MLGGALMVQRPAAFPADGEAAQWEVPEGED
jgi:hypothetical protein